MPEPLFIKKIAASDLPLKLAKFHQSLIRFGLPCAALAIGIDYAAFRITTSGSGLRYPWGSSLLFAVPAALAMAAVLSRIMREIAAWKRKNQL